VGAIIAPDCKLPVKAMPPLWQSSSQLGDVWQTRPSLSPKGANRGPQTFPLQTGLL
jgi:hypothetical protein